MGKRDSNILERIRYAIGRQKQENGKNNYF